MKRFIICYSLFIFLAVPAFAQEIPTADKYLEVVGQRYAAIKDYQAKVTIESAKTVMRGTLIHKTPNLLRIDFTSPEEQVIAYNGETLTVYLPEYRAVLSQSAASGSKAPGASLASAQGLTVMRRNYAAAFTVGPDPVPLEEGSAETVVQLTLSRRSLSEGFRDIRLSIDPKASLIRRIEGVTIAGETVRIDFTEIVLNQGIPEARFAYDSPASANLYNNFLFKQTD